MADAANFILKMKPFYKGKWIVFGCSYSGALSAWFRSKYPNLVVGSVSPSGPLLAVENFYKLLQNFQLVARTILSLILFLFIFAFAIPCFPFDVLSEFSVLLYVGSH